MSFSVKNLAALWCRNMKAKNQMNLFFHFRNRKTILVAAAFETTEAATKCERERGREKVRERKKVRKLSCFDGKMKRKSEIDYLS